MFQAFFFLAVVADGFIVWFIEVHSGSMNDDAYPTFWTKHTGLQLNRLEISVLNKPTFLCAVGELSELWLLSATVITDL